MIIRWRLAMRKRVFWVFGLSVAAILCLSAAAHADVYMKQTRHTDAFTVMGQTQPEKNETVIYWFTSDRVRMDTGESQSTIVLLDKKVMYVIDHVNKRYTEIPVDVQKALEAAAGEKGNEESAKAKEEYQKTAESFMKRIEVKVRDTGETQKIRDWDCRKYVVDLTMTMGKSQSEFWTTESIKIDPKAYWTASNAMLAAQPGFEKILDEMKKVKGVVVRNVTTATVMETAVKSTEELLEIAEKPAPAGIFDLPKDYKKIEGMMMK
jgi:hypothetical protein